MSIDFNTQGGAIGFRAELADGRVFEELRCTWDDVPKDAALKALKLVHFRTGHVFATCDGYAEYFFSNEATETMGMAGRGRVMMHSAKIFGGVRASGEVNIVRLTWPRDAVVPIGRRVECAREDLLLSPAAFRLGLGTAAPPRLGVVR